MVFKMVICVIQKKRGGNNLNIQQETKKLNCDYMHTMGYYVTVKMKENSNIDEP